MADVRFGVSSSLLQRILDEINPRSSNATTADVSQYLMKAHTAKHRCAFAKLFAESTDSTGAPYVATATVFVSHVWSTQFSLLVEAANDYAEAHPATYFWIDVVSSNQHEEPRKEEAIRSTPKIIESIGAGLLVITDPNNSSKLTPMTRLWCLWECVCILNSEASFNIVVPSSQHQTLTDSLSVKGTESLTTVSIRTDFVHAATYKKDVRVQLLAALSETDPLSFWPQLSGILKQYYVKLLVFKGYQASSSIDTLASALTTIDALRQLLAPEDTLALCQHTLAIVSTSADSIELASLYDNAGWAYIKQGYSLDAIQCYKKSVDIRRRLKGAQDPGLVDAYYQLSLAYSLSGQTSKSIELCRCCVDLASAITTTSLQRYQLAASLTQLYLDQSRYAPALEYAIQALSHSKAVNGNQHHHTLSAQIQVGHCHFGLGDYHSAYTTLHTCLRAVNSRNCSIDLGLLYQLLGLTSSYLGSLHAAAKWYACSLQSRREVYGEDHPHALAACVHATLAQIILEQQNVHKQSCCALQ